MLGHGHSIGDVSGLQSALESKAAYSHGHVIGDVTGLQSALDAKAAGADAPLRLMVVEGRISASGIGLSSAQSAALLYDGKQIIVRLSQGAPDPQIDLAQGKRGIKIKVVRQ